MAELEFESHFYYTPLNGLCMFINICLNLHVYIHTSNHISNCGYVSRNEYTSNYSDYKQKCSHIFIDKNIHLYLFFNLPIILPFSIWKYVCIQYMFW